MADVKDFTPWHVADTKIYECQRCKFATERYRSKDNVPKFAHLCRACWEEDIHKTHYIAVEEIASTAGKKVCKPPPPGWCDAFDIVDDLRIAVNVPCDGIVVDDNVHPNLGRCVGDASNPRGPARVTSTNGLYASVAPSVLGAYVRFLPFGTQVEVIGSNDRGYLQLSDGSWVCSTAIEGDLRQSGREKSNPQPWVRPL